MGRNSRIKEKSVGLLEYSKEEICRNKKKLTQNMPTQNKVVEECKNSSRFKISVNFSTLLINEKKILDGKNTAICY